MSQFNGYADIVNERLAEPEVAPSAPAEPAPVPQEVPVPHQARQAPSPLRIDLSRVADQVRLFSENFESLSARFQSQDRGARPEPVRPTTNAPSEGFDQLANLYSASPRLGTPSPVRRRSGRAVFVQDETHSVDEPAKLRAMVKAYFKDFIGRGQPHQDNLCRLWPTDVANSVNNRALVQKEIERMAFLLLATLNDIE